MTLVYLDTSAAAKLLVDEEETEALQDHLRQVPEAETVTSVIGLIELRRVAARIGPAHTIRAEDLARRLGSVQLTEAVAHGAAHVSPTVLRSLDAIHLASAVSVSADQVLCYDQRLSTAAEAAGLLVLSPRATG